MKFELLKNRLVPVLYKVEKVSGKNLNLPILECVLLDLKGNVLTLSATNLDLGVKMSIPVKGQGNGVVAMISGVQNSSPMLRYSGLTTDRKSVV